MANLKDIRRRIKSVKNTQKITQAMRMVAAAKVKRAENKVKAIRPYSEQLKQILADVSAIATQQPELLSELPEGRWLLPASKPKTLGVIVVSSDRGLCGSFNSTVIRQAFALEKHLKSQGITPKFYLIGRKVTQAFGRYSDSEIMGSLTDMTAAPTTQDANQVIKAVSEAFLNGEIDGIEVLSTHFKSMISYKVYSNSLLPAIQPERADFLPEHLLSDALDNDSTTANKELLVEPNPVDVLKTLIPLYLSNQLYTYLLESSASELAARMTAMANATNNASDMIGKLTITYNKLRQAAITQEILEIVGGAAALA